MTREEKQKAVDVLKISAPVMATTQEEFDDYIKTLNKIMDWLEQEPCDAISRQSVLNMQYRIDDSATLSTRDVVNVDDIVDLPPANPQVKTGHWVEENINEWSRKVFCSECGGQPPFEYVSTGDVYSASGYGVINKTKFCPNCGAKMRAESEAQEGAIKNEQTM